MNSQIWWFVARSAGIAAWACGALAVLWGMALSTRALGKRVKAPWLRDMHQWLGGLTVSFVAVHLIALLADSYVHFDIADLLVPFASSWKPGAVALGVVAFWLLAAVEITSLAMKRLPRRWWKKIHFSSYAVYLLTTAHFLLAGTDAGLLGLRIAVAVSLGLVCFFTVYLAIGPGRRGDVPARQAVRTGPNVGAQPVAARVPARSR